MTDRHPAERFRPQVFVKEELEARGWTTADLARLTHYPVSFWTVWLSNESLGVDENLAARLAVAFEGTGMDTWLNLDKSR